MLGALVVRARRDIGSPCGSAHDVHVDVRAVTFAGLALCSRPRCTPRRPSRDAKRPFRRPLKVLHRPRVPASNRASLLTARPPLARSQT